MALERLQKILARAGVASRRRAEALIVAGRVRVDGKTVTELGTRCDARDAKVEVDGKRLFPEAQVYGVLHKPRGVVSTLHDPEGRPTVLELLKAVGARVVPVGRLDYHTSGTLLFSNDGDFTETLSHPRRQVPRLYLVKVQGIVDDVALERWTERIEVAGRKTQSASVRRLRVEGDKTWLEVGLREGRNRQIHRLGESAGFRVLRLVRLAQAGITHDGLRPGEWRLLSADELVKLKRQYGVPHRVRVPVPLAAPAKGRQAPRGKKRAIKARRKR
jgi:23S rRNA pseudouridine2605 synthase